MRSTILTIYHYSSDFEDSAMNKSQSFFKMLTFHGWWWEGGKKMNKYITCWGINIL